MIIAGPRVPVRGGDHLKECDPFWAFVSADEWAGGGELDFATTGDREARWSVTGVIRDDCAVHGLRHRRCRGGEGCALHSAPG